MIDASQFLGPVGGLLSVTFGTGAVAGWGFAMKLMSARIAGLDQRLKDEREDCARQLGLVRADMDRERTEAHERFRKLEQFMIDMAAGKLRGLERENDQLRESGIRVIRDEREGFSR